MQILRIILILCFYEYSVENVMRNSLNEARNSLNEAWIHIKDSVHCIMPSKKPSEEDVKFFLYSSKNVNNSEEVKDLKLNDTKNFNKSLDTKVLIHGFTQSYKNELFVNMKNAYLLTELLNVVMVNWEKLAAPPCYPVAADYTAFVGQLTGYLLKDVNPKKIHIIGFSLGAHIAGIASQLQKTKVLRITGLDPAMPMFFKSSETKRLDPGDALNVDVIHTSVLGYPSRVGHADFYVNGAILQPNCKTTDLACSHKRSIELYIKTILCQKCYVGRSCGSQNEFEDKKCENNSISIMGEAWLTSGAMRGSFYLSVNRSNDINTTTHKNIAKI